MIFLLIVEWARNACGVFFVTHVTGPHKIGHLQLDQVSRQKIKLDVPTLFGTARHNCAIEVSVVGKIRRDELLLLKGQTMEDARSLCLDPASLLDLKSKCHIFLQRKLGKLLGCAGLLSLWVGDGLARSWSHKV